MSRIRVVPRLALVSLIFVLITGEAAQAPVQTPNASLERAKALWEEAVKAKGGRERLHSIQNFVISSTIGATDIERLYDMPGKVWTYMFNPKWNTPGPVDVRIINSNQNISTMNLSGRPADLGGAFRFGYEFHMLVQEPAIYLMETKWLHPTPISSRTEGKGTSQVDVVEAEIGGIQLQYYLDRKTRLPTKIVTSSASLIQPGVRGGPPDMTITLGSYVTVDGLRMPRAIDRTWMVGDTNNKSARLESETARYRFDVEYNSDIFEGWRPQNRQRNDWQPQKDHGPIKDTASLIERLKSKDEWVRDNAFRKIVGLGSAATPELQVFINREKGDPRVMAASALFDIDPTNPVALAALKETISNGKGRMLIEAAARIASTDPESDFTVAPLLKEATRTIIIPNLNNMRNLSDAALALGLTAPGVRALTGLLRYADSWIRLSAVSALDELTESLADAPAPVRESVRKSIPDLVNALTDKNETVRAAVEEILIQIGPDAIASLNSAVGGNDARLSNAAAITLVKIEQAPRQR